MYKKISILILIILCFIFGGIYYYKNTKKSVLDNLGNINEITDITFESKETNTLDNNYTLDLKEDKLEYFKTNLEEGYEHNLLLTSSDLMFNKTVLQNLIELYNQLETEGINDLIIRRAYLECEDGDDTCVTDHRTGYDIDFQIKDNDMESFEGYESGDYLLANAYKYGFVLRYKTKDNYQPWHYRYVGKINAYIIKNQNMTIEKYIDSLEENIIYKIQDTNDYVYKVSGTSILVPTTDYEISSVGNNSYIITFSLN